MTDATYGDLTHGVMCDIMKSDSPAYKKLELTVRTHG